MMKKILIFEDDRELAGLWREALEEHGYDVVHVARFDEASERIEQDDFDLVIADMLIRENRTDVTPRGGISLMSKINLGPKPRPRVIAVSGAGQHLNILKFAATLKADATLVKPILIEELLEQVERSLARDRSENQSE